MLNPLRAHPRLTAAVVLALLVLAGIGAVVLYPQLAAAQQWRRAEQALDEYDFKAAQVSLRECLTTWPDSAEVHFLLARTSRRASDFDTARGHLKEADRLGWPAALHDLEGMLIQAQLGAVRPVEEPLRRYLALYPDEAKVILEALVIGYLQGNYLDEAYHTSRRWLERYPEDWAARFWHGRVLERGLRYDLAADAYQGALERNPNHAPLHLRRGEVLLWKGRYAEALPHFEACLKGDLENGAALLGLARCQRVLSTAETTRATLERLAARWPDYPGASLLRGQLELDGDRVEEAVNWLRRAEARDPMDMDTTQALATALRLLKREPEAEVYEAKKRRIEQDLRRMEQLTKDIIARPKDIALRHEAGTTLLRLGREHQGIQWLVSALLIDPSHKATRTALRESLAKLGDAKLVEQYRAILEDGAQEEAVPK